MTEPASYADPPLPPLPTLGAVSRRPPVGGARRSWVTARVEEVRPETATARTVRLALPPGSEAHVPGQHYVVRRRRDDGSWAQRSYSAASAPARVGPGESRPVELTVERLEDGELSPYLHGVRPGDEVELRGPFGGWFLWRYDGPALLVGGGSGVVPLMSMLRTWRADPGPDPMRLVVSVRAPEDLYYAAELTGPAAGPDVTVVHSRRAPVGGSPQRLDRAVLEPLLLPGATCFVCGSARFAEHASGLLVELGVSASDVRVERFGPS